ncbi:MAG: helix-turn-helix transcriptional regulator [Actinomycetota bacterium]
MVPWSAAGDLLRWWRHDILAISQQQAAERLSVQPSALSNWEHGARAVSIELDQLDAALDGNGVLADMLWALGTPKGLDARPVWDHAFRHGPGPVWAWIRSPSPRVRVSAEWGVARLDEEFTLEPNGQFITVARSVPESPIRYELDPPGWVDFGRGALPTQIPGADVVAGIDLMRRSSANGAFMQLFISNLAERVGGARGRDLAALGPKAIGSYLSATLRNRPIAQTEPWQIFEDEIAEIDRLRFGRLRRARGLSLAETATLLRHQTDLHIGKETLRRFETDVGQPHDRYLPSALDYALGGGGSLGLTCLASGEGPGSVSFPPYWYGPAWFEVDATGRPPTLRLQWGDWYRQIRVQTPALLSFTCTTPDAPIRIVTDSDVSWRFGVGVRSGAASINHNWVPASVSIAQRALSDTEGAIARSLRR